MGIRDWGETRKGLGTVPIRGAGGVARNICDAAVKMGLSPSAPQEDIIGWEFGILLEMQPMSEPCSQPALKYEAEVRDGGRVEVTVPFAQGTRVVVFVVGQPETTFHDLVSASESTLGFWDNPLDDEDWNDA